MPEYLYTVWVVGGSPKLAQAEIAKRGTKEIMIKETNLAFEFRKRFPASAFPPMCSPRAAWESFLAKQRYFQEVAYRQAERASSNVLKAVEELDKLPSVVG